MCHDVYGTKYIFALFFVSISFLKLLPCLLSRIFCPRDVGVLQTFESLAQRNQIKHLWIRQTSPTEIEPLHYALIGFNVVTYIYHAVKAYQIVTNTYNFACRPFHCIIYILDIQSQSPLASPHPQCALNVRYCQSLFTNNGPHNMLTGCYSS